MRGRRLAALAVVTAFAVSAAVAVAARPRAGRVAAPGVQPPPLGGPLLVVSLDGLSWAWLQRYALGPATPHLARLVARSAAAVYNPLAEPHQPLRAYLTAATGKVWPASGRLVSVGEAPGSAALAPPGWLGQGLARAGVSRAIWGDTAWLRGAEEVPAAYRETSPAALAALLLVDQAGEVPTRGISREDPAAPGGLRTRWELLPELMGSLGPGPWVAVVASGDLWRLEQAGPELPPFVAEAHHRRLARQLDRLVARWEQGAGREGGSLLLVGLSAHPRRRATGEQLTALVWAGPWGPGWWTGGTTRRAAFVTSLDLAPALARAVGLPELPPSVGRPWQLLPGPVQPEQLAAFARERASIVAHRFSVLPTLTTLQVLALTAVAGWLTVAWASGRPLAVPAGVPVVVAGWAAAVPLALLHPWAALPPVGWLSGPDGSLLFAGAVALVLAWAAWALAGGRGVYATALLCAASAVAVLGDALGRWDLVARSYMGYDLIAGARFYGIGNEHAGLLLGSALVVLAASLTRSRRARAAGWAVLAVAAAVVGMPPGGANVGGAVACAAGFTVAALAWRGLPEPGHRGAPQRALAGLMAAALLVAGAAAWDLRLGGHSQTHLARTVELAQAVGPGYLGDVAARKVALNLRLIRYSLYSRVAAVAMLVVAAALWRGYGPLLEDVDRHPGLRVALEASAVGALVALLANDSGITAAATALLGPAALVLEHGARHSRPPRPWGAPAAREGEGS